MTDFGQEWVWWIKLLATAAVEIPVILFMVWLLWFSKWAKPKADKDDVR